MDGRLIKRPSRDTETRRKQDRNQERNGNRDGDRNRTRIKEKWRNTALERSREGGRMKGETKDTL